MKDKPIVILLSGVSGSGKTTLAKSRVIELEKEKMIFIHQEADFIAKKINSHDLKSISEIALAPVKRGQNIIIDGLLPYDNEIEIENTLKMLKKYQLVYVGVHCSLDVLKERENKRKNRTAGWAEKQFQNLHKGARYDVEVDTTSKSPKENSKIIIDYIKNRKFY